MNQSWDKTETILRQYSGHSRSLTLFHIFSVGEDLLCSSRKSWTLYSNSLEDDFVAKSCGCWNKFRTRKCKKIGQLLKIGNRKLKGNPKLPYFIRTDTFSRSMGDTSDLWGHPNDFVYIYDKTCSEFSARNLSNSSSVLMRKWILFFLLFLQ